MPGAVSSTNSRRKAAAKALRSRPITTRSACGAHCSWAQHLPTRVRRSHSLHVRRLSSRSSPSGSGTSTATRAKPRRPGGALALRRRPGAGAPPVRLVGPRAVRPRTAVPVAAVILPRELAPSLLSAFVAERVATRGQRAGRFRSSMQPQRFLRRAGRRASTKRTRGTVRFRLLVPTHTSLPTGCQCQCLASTVTGRILLLVLLKVQVSQEPLFPTTPAGEMILKGATQNVVGKGRDEHLRVRSAPSPHQHKTP